MVEHIGRKLPAQIKFHIICNIFAYFVHSQKYRKQLVDNRCFNAYTESTLYNKTVSVRLRKIVSTQVRLLLKEQTDQGIFPFHHNTSQPCFLLDFHEQFQALNSNLFFLFFNLNSFVVGTQKNVSMRSLF